MHKKIKKIKYWFSILTIIVMMSYYRRIIILNIISYLI